MYIYMYGMGDQTLVWGNYNYNQSQTCTLIWQHFFVRNYCIRNNRYICIHKPIIHIHYISLYNDIHLYNIFSVVLWHIFPPTNSQFIMIYLQQICYQAFSGSEAYHVDKLWANSSCVRLHPWKLTAGKLQISCLKRKVICQTIIFRFYVNLQGCNWTSIGASTPYNQLLDSWRHKNAHKDIFTP